MSEVISWFAEHASRLTALGYDCIPITRPSDPGPAAGKRPAMAKGWQQGCPAAEWPRYAACGVGILARRTPAIDIDVLDEEIADHIQAFVDRHLGEGAVRVGQWPKRLLVFRNAGEPFKKMRLEWRGAYDELHEPHRPPAVEILADGQQHVALGIHPGTQRPYHWLRDPGLSIPRALLPPLDEAVAARFMRALAFVLQEIGASEIRLTGVPEPHLEPRMPYQPSGRHPAEGLLATLHGGVRAPYEDEAERIRAALERMGNDQDYDGWIRIGLAIKAALGEGGAELFFWWSSLSTKDNPDLTRRKWASFQPRSVGAGTIFFESI